MVERIMGESEFGVHFQKGIPIPPKIIYLITTVVKLFQKIFKLSRITVRNYKAY